MRTLRSARRCDQAAAAEIGVAVVGGLEEGVAGRQTDSKALVAIAAEADGPGIGRIRMQVMEAPRRTACTPS